MNKRRFRLILFVFLLFMQFTASKFLTEYRINIDFIFLILIYFIMRKRYSTTIVVSVIAGWLTDYFAGSTLGVYGFARVTIAFILYGVMNYIDSKRLFSTFLIIFLSLSISNLIANMFLLFIYSYNFSSDLLLIQPFLTALTGILLLSSESVRKALNVH